MPINCCTFFISVQLITLNTFWIQRQREMRRFIGKHSNLILLAVVATAVVSAIVLSKVSKGLSWFPLASPWTWTSSTLGAFSSLPYSSHHPIVCIYSSPFSSILFSVTLLLAYIVVKIPSELCLDAIFLLPFRFSIV